MRIASKQKELLNWGHNILKGSGHNPSTPTHRSTSSFSSPIQLGATEKQKDLLTPSEERDLDEAIRESSCNFENIDMLISTLTEQITTLEDENIKGILAANDQVHSVVEGLQGCMKRLDKLGDWMSQNYADLERMKIDLDSIEGTNSKVQIRSENQRLLQRELTLLETNISKPKDTLDFGNIDFKDDVELAHALTGIRDLLQLLGRVGAGELSQMESIKSQQNQLIELRESFSKGFFRFIEEHLGDLASQAIESRRKGNRRQDLQLKGYQGIKEGLQKYGTILECLRTYYPKEHNSFLSEYETTMKTVYRKAFSYFFNELRQRAYRDLKKPFGLLPLGSKLLENAEKATKKAPGPRGESSSQTGSAHSDSESIISMMPDDESSDPNLSGSFDSRAESQASRGDRRGYEDCFAMTRKGERLKMSKAYGYALSFVVPAIVAETQFIGELFGFSLPTNTQSNHDEAVRRIRWSQTLENIFETLADELKSFAEWLDKQDPLNNISIILTTEQVKNQLEKDKSFLLDQFEGLMEIQEKKFNKFVKEQIESIQECKISAKRCGIVPCFYKFPYFVSAVEFMSGNTAQARIDQMYTKIAVAMFEWMIQIAQQNPKYTRVSIMENMHYFHTSLTGKCPPKLVEFDQKSITLYDENQRGYLSWHIEKQFPKLVRFFDDLVKLLTTVSEEEVQFESSHSKEAAKKMIKTVDQTFDKNVIKMYKRARKHLDPQHGLLPHVWSLLVDRFVEIYKEYDSMVKRCYKTLSLSPPSDSIKDRIDTVIKGYQARHADGGYDSPSETASSYSVARSAFRGFGLRS